MFTATSGGLRMNRLTSAFRCAVLVGPAIASLGLLSAANGQTLVADYQLQNVYTSSVNSGIGPLTPTGDTSAISFEPATVDGVSQQVLNFVDVESESVSGYYDEAGVQAQTNGFVDPSNYSVVLLADFSLTTDVLATKVMDFKNLSSDAGLYVNDSTGLLYFNGALTGSNGVPTGGTPTVSGTYTQIVLTRDSSDNTVTVYQDGTEAFSFDDTSDLAVLGDATDTGNQFLTLFQDDGTGPGGTLDDEDSLGDIARVRLYNGVLSTQQVAALDTTAVPKPTSLAALAAASLLPRRRRATGSAAR